ncbi:conserved hypothetical protein, precursor [Deinococcus maricopensis DSM 21211]|uniref:Uncharacterized protein n=1 Tax=Deinococcus maricopensis (strain DSM 21211 / LMG 22137 / NRRL B-23946 / LB-34) TaxID=709986 RepID=E8UBS4_DEIML|nr:conserved hypothetical protein, precursor [Deinococcus maricopensis DSM 21211]
MLLGTLTVILAVLAFGCAALSLGAFAGLNPASPSALRLLSAVEGTLASGAHLPLEAFWRGAAEVVLAGVCMWMAAYIKPR